MKPAAGTSTDGVEGTGRVALRAVPETPCTMEAAWGLLRWWRVEAPGPSGGPVGAPR